MPESGGPLCRHLSGQAPTGICRRLLTESPGEDHQGNVQKEKGTVLPGSGTPGRAEKGTEKPSLCPTKWLHTLQVAAAIKCLGANTGYTIRNNNICQAAAIEESTFFDLWHSVRNRDI